MHGNPTRDLQAFIADRSLLLPSVVDFEAIFSRRWRPGGRVRGGAPGRFPQPERRRLGLRRARGLHPDPLQGGRPALTTMNPKPRNRTDPRASRPRSCGASGGGHCGLCTEALKRRDATRGEGGTRGKDWHPRGHPRPVHVQLCGTHIGLFATQRHPYPPLRHLQLQR